MRWKVRGIALGLLLPMGVWGAAQVPEPGEPGKLKPDAPAGPAGVAVAWTTAVEPKPITPTVKKGLDWLVEHQLKDGGWGQGDESQPMGGGAGLRDKSNVADTSVAALSLIRSGSTPSAGPYHDAVARAVGFVRSHVEASDSASLAVSTVQGTRVQQKLGPNIDTFLASLLLAEVKGRMPEPAGNQAVEVALNKVLGKIKAHQKADGSWDNQAGWAPILAQSMAGKGINRASQNGAVVAPEVLARTESYAKLQLAQNSAPAAIGGGSLGGGGFAGAGGGIGGSSLSGPVVVAAAPASAEVKSPGGGFAGGGAGIGGAGISGPTSVAAAPAAGEIRSFSATSRGGRTAGGLGSAGVELYDRASSLSVLQDSVNSNALKEAEFRKVAESSRDDKVVAEARKELGRFEAARLACSSAKEQVVARLDDKGFLAGFGSNGGEEFLSYMNIGESLVLQGGPAWTKWDQAMTANLNRIQNDDGSWTGNHCITGRTFCTSTALLVLLGDRTPVPGKAREKAPAP